LLAAMLLLRAAAVRVPIRRNAGSIATYSITYHFVMTGGHGEHDQGDSYRGQDSNGNRVDGYPMRNFDRIIHFARGIDVEIGKTGKTITTWGVGAPRIDELPPPNCRDGDPAPIKLEEIKTMLGFEVVRNKHSIIDEWRAPALGCQPLWSRADFGDGYTLEIATSAAVKPDSPMFLLPVDAVEVSPKEYRELLGLKPSTLVTPNSWNYSCGTTSGKRQSAKEVWGLCSGADGLRWPESLPQC
jgi:hypothetical protein